LIFNEALELAPMKNIHNLITDAFVRIGYRESDYHISVNYIHSRDITVHIESKNPNAIGESSLYLMMSAAGQLLDYEEMNQLFLDDIWDEFCSMFDNQIR